MTPTREEVRRELSRLSEENVLAPQERALLEMIVACTMEGHTSRLYQKAIADDLGVGSAKQIGVLATRIRTKLRAHYQGMATRPVLEVQLSDRGYEAKFQYFLAHRPLTDSATLLVANARAALEQRTLPGIASAFKYVEKGLAKERDHLSFLSLKAQCYATRAIYGASPAADLRRAEDILLAIDPAGEHPWEYWFAYASVRMALHWDWSGAEAAFGQAIALSNGEARLNAWHTAFLASQQRTAEAVDHLRVAVSRAPDSPILRADLAINQIYAGQFDDAEQTIGTAFELFGPRAHYLLYVHLAILYEARGEGTRAIEAIERVPLRWPKTAITLGLRALFNGLSGRRRVARWQLSKLRGVRLLAGRKVPAIHMAVATLGAGDADGAVAWLRQASVVERDPNAILNNVYPFFRHLHLHPRFRELIVEKMNLPLPRRSHSSS